MIYNAPNPIFNSNTNIMPDSKIYLNVPYAQKDTAKALGAKWDPAKKQWYVPASMDITLFAKWQGEASTVKSSTPAKGNSKSRASNKNVVLGVTTYGKNKDLTTCSKDAPPWD